MGMTVIMAMRMGMGMRVCMSMGMGMSVAVPAHDTLELLPVNVQFLEGLAPHAVQKGQVNGLAYVFFDDFFPAA